jgi:prepilin-type N-terminal cleavage/methylation domain-containing protein
MQKFFKNKKGFTLLELLVVVGLIAVLAAVVIALLNNARDKGANAGIQSNLFNAISQGEIFYNTNTSVPNTYTAVCTNGIVGGAMGVGLNVFTAAKVAGMSGYVTNGTGSNTTATCNDSATAWAAEVPLKTGGFWCVDSAGISRQTNTSIGSGVMCN